jgi:hypothetical protein
MAARNAQHAQQKLLPYLNHQHKRLFHAAVLSVPTFNNCRRQINAASDAAVYVMDRRLRGGGSSSSRRNLHKDAYSQQEMPVESDDRVYRRHGAQKSRYAGMNSSCVLLRPVVLPPGTAFC